MTDLEVGIDGVERPRPSGGDCSLPASALTKQKAGGRNPGSGEGREGGPEFATVSSATCPAPRTLPHFWSLSISSPWIPLIIGSLDTRRHAHISDLVETILDKRCHPAFFDFFTVDNKGVVAAKITPRLRIGAKRFAVMGPTIYIEAHLSPGV